jgi:hypothetical protein
VYYGKMLRECSAWPADDIFPDSHIAQQK